MSEISQFKKSKKYPNLYSIWTVWAIGKIENKFITYNELLYGYKTFFPTRELARQYKKDNLKEIIEFKKEYKRKERETDDLYNSEW